MSPFRVSCVFMLLPDLIDHFVNVGLPRKQKISVNKCWVRESEIGEECRQVWA